MEEFIGVVSRCLGIPNASCSASGMAYLIALNENWLLHSAERVPAHDGLLHP